ncbi:general substrate transporter [Phaeosphaeriaceae sp. SRC1lsM3a]|nr:general substrate transporter [Stagonospora sp. SRC1lsM3a]
MGIFNQKKSKGAERSVGAELAAVLPNDDRPWYRVPHLLKLNLTLLVPLISAGAVGYDGSMMNGLQSLPQWRNFFGKPDGALLGAMNSVYPAGKVVALFLVTYLADRFGRKPTIFIGIVACIAFAIMQGLAQNFSTFIAARAVLGFFTSFLAQPSPILVAELAYPTHRGKITALYNTSFYLGGIIAAWMAYGMSGWTSNWAWRIPSIVQGALPLIQLAGIYFVPESPRWLAAHGKVAEARKVIADYHAGGDQESPLVKFEMAEIESAITFEADSVSQNSWFELVRTPANRKRTLIAVLVGWFAQWNGVGIISYYLTLVLNTIGITKAKEQTRINGILQITNWLAAIFAGAMMVDRLGRRTLFLTSTGGMCVSYVVWTGLTSNFVRTGNESIGQAVVAFIFIFFFFYAIAWAPLLQAYIVEIYPYTLRGRGVSAMYVSTFLGLVVGNQVNPIAMKSIGWKYYIFFCCLLAVLFVIIWVVFPETKGHSLEEIREVFEGKRSEKTVEEAEAGEDDDTNEKEKENKVRQIELA